MTSGRSYGRSTSLALQVTGVSCIGLIGRLFGVGLYRLVRLSRFAAVAPSLCEAGMWSLPCMMMARRCMARRCTIGVAVSSV
nr:MAG TPA: hypothetical protein [Caudoviricetes sp.]